MRSYTQKYGYDNPEYRPTYPSRIQVGTVVNQLKIVEVEMRMSALYRRPYRTGNFFAKCLVCGNTITVNKYNFRPNLPNKSKLACCIKRVRTDFGRVLSPDNPTGRKPLDLVTEQFGKLLVLQRLSKQGWRCGCECGREIVVPRSYQLLRGTIDACKVCTKEAKKSTLQ